MSDPGVDIDTIGFEGRQLLRHMIWGAIQGMRRVASRGVATGSIPSK